MIAFAIAVLTITCKTIVYSQITVKNQVDIGGNKWSQIASLLTARQEFAGAYLNGKIYVAGGMDANICCNAINRFDEYDIATDKWKQKADLPMNLNHSGICALSGKIYIISGYTGGNYSGQGVTKNCYVYTPLTNSWAEISPLPIACAAPGVVTYKGKIYVFGGNKNIGFDTFGNKTVYEYDPDKNSWVLINNQMPYGRCHIGTGLIGSKVYLSPGRPGRIERSKDDIVQEFDFTKMEKGADAWRVMNSLPGRARTGYISNWPVVNGRLYYIGGEMPDPVTPDVHVFTPDANGGKWNKIADYPTPVHGIGPVAVGNDIYVFGGGIGGGVQMKTANSYKLTVQNCDTQFFKEERWECLFNGYDLSGWFPVGKGKWWVEDNMIIGTRGEFKKGGYLFTNKKTYENFELQVDVFIDWGVDTGIALRDISSNDKEYDSGHGYHCCLDYWSRGTSKNGHIGGLYYKKPRPETNEFSYFLPTWPFQFKDPYTSIDNTKFDASKYKKQYDVEKWNNEVWNSMSWNTIKVRIENNPPKYQCWVNGVKTMVFQDIVIRNEGKGKIGFQIINDPNWVKGGKVRYRNIYVRELH